MIFFLTFIQFFMGKYAYFEWKTTDLVFNLCFQISSVCTLDLGQAL